MFATFISPHEESLFAGHLEWVSCVRLLPDEIIDRKNRQLAVVVRCEVARDGVIGCFADGESDALLVRARRNPGRAWWRSGPTHGTWVHWRRFVTGVQAKVRMVRVSEFPVRHH